VCTDTDANIENDDDFLLFFRKEDLEISRNCVLNPDSRREKEKEKVLSVFPSLPLRVSETLHKINRVVVV